MLPAGLPLDAIKILGRADNYEFSRLLEFGHWEMCTWKLKSRGDRTDLYSAGYSEASRL